ncbi:MAG TPA: FAD:protein FMN transferase [Thermodesulfovibrionales bacterium]|nr:FAD:protein FMN transferase [Thermodesulfovibrionales bacterium]
MIIKITVIVMALLLFVLLASCSSGKKMYKETHVSLYTVVTVTVYADSQQKATAAIDNAFNELDRLGKLLNFYSDDSEVAKINHSAGIRPVKVSEDTIRVIKKALYISRVTDGAFDITIGPIVKLWDFEKHILPDEKDIKARLHLINYRDVVIDEKNSTVFLKKKGMAVDLGGIAKGYAADRAVEILKQNRITEGIIAVGGEVKPFGKKPGGGAWRVGIKNPDRRDEENDVFAIVNLDDKAISTSGGYEKFFVKEGKTYHHILDPKTGYPVYGCKSVSIIAKDAPDGFPTGIFVLGPQKGIAVVKRLGIDAVIMDKDGNIIVTDGIRDKVELITKNN